LYSFKCHPLCVVDENTGEKAKAMEEKEKKKKKKKKKGGKHPKARVLLCLPLPSFSLHLASSFLLPLLNKCITAKPHLAAFATKAHVPKKEQDGGEGR
jgi:hypothetical protein